MRADPLAPGTGGPRTAATPSASAPAIGGPPAPARGRGRTWLRAAGAVFAVAWGGNQFTPLLVLYRDGARLGDQVVDLLLAVYVLGIIPAVLLGGALSDRVGRRRLVVPAPFIAAAGSVVLASSGGAVPLLVAGRILSGIALGLVMAAGTSWVTELSAAPFGRAPDAAAGARRSSLALTGGFALGAVVAAGLAQFAPAPGVVPYLVHAGVAVALGALVLTCPETRPPSAGARAVWRGLRIPSASHRRFRTVVLPAAPWVFTTATCAYAVLPSLAAPLAPDLDIAMAGVLCLVALGCGFAVQPLVRRVGGVQGGGRTGLGLGLAAVGMAAAAVAALTLNLLVILAAAAILGTAYGVVLVSGLIEVQAIATREDLAGLTGVYYSLTYLGFFVPALLVLGARWVSYPAMLGVGGMLAAAWAITVAVAGARDDRRVAVPRGG